VAITTPFVKACVSHHLQETRRIYHRKKLDIVSGRLWSALLLKLVSSIEEPGVVK